MTSALRSTSTSAHFPHEEWDPESCAFAQAKIDEVIVALLLLLAEMLPLLASLPGQEQIGAGRRPCLVCLIESPPQGEAADHLLESHYSPQVPLPDYQHCLKAASAVPMHCRATEFLTRTPHSPLPPKKTTISGIVRRLMQALYFYLSSDSKPKSCAALVLLSAVARHSVQSARQLAHHFDFSLSSLAKLCRLPRYAWHA